MKSPWISQGLQVALSVAACGLMTVRDRIAGMWYSRGPGQAWRDSVAIAPARLLQVAQNAGRR